MVLVCWHIRLLRLDLAADGVVFYFCFSEQSVEHRWCESQTAGKEMEDGIKVNFFYSYFHINYFWTFTYSHMLIISSNKQAV